MTGTRISKLLRQINILLIICCCSLSTQAKYGGGSGTPEDPYQIWDANHMQAIGADSNDWDKNFKLMADINIAQYTGTEFNIIGYYVDYTMPRKPFTGVFDGNGHRIWNFTYTCADVNSVGLFMFVEGGRIENLNLLGPNIAIGGTGIKGTAALVATLLRGSVDNCYVVGGKVYGSSYVGGLVGVNSYYSTISNSGVFCDVNGSYGVGGLVGYNNEGDVLDCYSTGTVFGELSVGGLIGYSRGETWQCYSESNVFGVERVGGLIGHNFVSGDPEANVWSCYSKGYVHGVDKVGGLIGENGWFGYSRCWSGVITNSYWDIETSGEPNMCGLQTDCSSGCDPNYGKTTAEMRKQSTFQDWDFINVWNIGENQTYPYLRTYLAGDINKDGIVNFKDFAYVALQWLEECNFGNRPPRVLITYPEDGARLMVGGVPPQTMIWAEASDYDGSVVRVEFFVDDLKLGEDTDGSDGWNYLWQNYSLGFHVLTAVAWDNEGLSGMSTPVNVEVWMPDPPPP